MNWNELKAYFGMAEQEGDASVRYTARLISDMLKDPINYLYFHFLSPVVTEFEKVNGYFQATNIDADELVQQLHLFYKSFTGRVYNRNGDALAVDNVDFGGKFIFEAMNLIKNSGNDGDVITKVNEAKGRCHSMLLEAASQLKKHLPTSQDMFRRLASVSPSFTDSESG